MATTLVVEDGIEQPEVTDDNKSVKQSCQAEKADLAGLFKSSLGIFFNQGFLSAESQFGGRDLFGYIGAIRLQYPSPNIVF